MEELNECDDSSCSDSMSLGPVEEGSDFSVLDFFSSSSSSSSLSCSDSSFTDDDGMDSGDSDFSSVTSKNHIKNSSVCKIKVESGVSQENGEIKEYFVWKKQVDTFTDNDVHHVNCSSLKITLKRSKVFQNASEQNAGTTSHESQKDTSDCDKDSVAKGKHSEQEYDSSNDSKKGKVSSSSSNQDLSQQVSSSSETECEDYSSCSPKLSKYRCHVCDLVLDCKDDYDEHFHTHEQEAVFCDICGENFDTQEAVDVHRLTHLVSELYACKICGHESKNKEEYLIHSRFHIGQSCYECQLCNKDLTSLDALEAHLYLHTGDKPYRCEMCDKSFRFFSAFKRHTDSHQKSYVCGICGDTFPSKLLCHQHKLKHAEKKIYECEICNKQFHRPYQLTGHLQVHEEDKKHVCKECGMTYAYKTSLLRHFHKYHSPNAQTFTCHLCGELFPNRRTLNSHVILHTAKKVIRCNECSRTFKYRSSLQRHKLVHQGVKPFPCPECGKSFRNNCHLKTHMAIHMSKDTFVCPKCGKTFGFQIFLNKHMMSHEEAAEHSEVQILAA